MNTNPDRIPVAEIGEADFQSEVLRSTCPVLAAFGAGWSRPCHILEAVLEEVAAVCVGRAKIVKVNADDNPELSMWYDIESIPTLLFFVDGSLRAKVVGTATKEAVLSKFKAILAGGRPSLPGDPRKNDEQGMV